MECEIENDIELLKKYIHNKDRLLHCISTAENMARYSDLFNIDYDTAYFCGLYHDLAKEMSPQEMLELAESFIKRDIVPIAYLDFKRNTPTLLHGVASAELLLREFTDIPKDRIAAICSHTLGGQKLSRLAKYMFMFDFCEPRRRYKEAHKVFNILIKEKDFDKAYLATYAYQIKDLLDKKKNICPESIEGYNEAIAYAKS